MTALATRYDVMTHVISSTLAEKVPCMWGSDTLATEVSTTSISVPSMEVKAMRYGLVLFAFSTIESRRPLSPGREPSGPARAPASPSASRVRRSPRCLLYTSDAADEEDSVDLGGRRI